MPSMTLTETLQKNTIKLAENIGFWILSYPRLIKTTLFPWSVRVTVRFRLIDLNFAPIIIWFMSMSCVLSQFMGLVKGKGACLLIERSSRNHTKHRPSRACDSNCQSYDSMPLESATQYSKVRHGVTPCIHAIQNARSALDYGCPIL